MRCVNLSIAGSVSIWRPYRVILRAWDTQSVAESVEVDPPSLCHVTVTSSIHPFHSGVWLCRRRIGVPGPMPIDSRPGISRRVASRVPVSAVGEIMSGRAPMTEEIEVHSSVMDHHSAGGSATPSVPASSVERSSSSSVPIICWSGADPSGVRSRRNEVDVGS